MDDKAKTGKIDDLRINVNESYEVRYWSEKFSITEEELKKAVAAVGPMASNVQDYLTNKKP